jgi:hypothetical protein
VVVEAEETPIMPKPAVILCPRCDAESTIRYVNRRVDGSLFRARSCSKCELKFSTEETINGTKSLQNAVCAISLIEVLESVGVCIDTTGIRIQN